jgi:EXLDI family protein
VSVPNKTIYVSDSDLPLFTRAQELAGGSLSSAISAALRRWVDTADALDGGFEDITVRVGLGAGRKVRFVAQLVGEWVDTKTSRADAYHVYRGRSGKFVIHVERSPDWWAVDAEGKPAGWRGWLGVGDIRYGVVPKESTLEVVDTLEELRDKVPPELFEMAVRATRQPTVEELDI